jgi:hypothetical protein
VHGLGFFLSNSRGIQGKDLEAVSRSMREEMHEAGSSAVCLVSAEHFHDQRHKKSPFVNYKIIHWPHLNLRSHHHITHFHCCNILYLQRPSRPPVLYFPQ